MPQLSIQAESEFNLSLPFCSVQALRGPTLGRATICFLPSSAIQMLMSSRNTQLDTPGNSALPALWISLSPVKLTHQINHQEQQNPAAQRQ